MIWSNGTDDTLSGDTWTLDSVDGPLIGDKDAISINDDSDSYWLVRTYYVPANNPVTIDLDDMFELNDEGILLSGDGITQSPLTFSAESLNGVSTNVTMDFSYKGLY